jgi:hypothetical protein
VLRQRFIHERVIRVEQAQDRAVFAKHVFKEADGLFVHVVAQLGELGKEFFIFLDVLVEVTDVQPLAGELNGEPPRAGIFEYAASLRDKHR